MQIKQFKWLCLALLIGLLASCAPATKGSAANAFSLDDDFIATTAGARVYIEDRWAPNAFGMSLAGPEFSTSSRSLSQMSDKFHLSDTNVPADWTLKLLSAEGETNVTNVTRSSRSKTAYYTTSIKFKFSVDVPEAVRAGVYALSASVTSEAGITKVIPIRVVVDDPGVYAAAPAR